MVFYYNLCARVCVCVGGGGFSYVKFCLCVGFFVCFGLNVHIWNSENPLDCLRRNSNINQNLLRLAIILINDRIYWTMKSLLVWFWPVKHRHWLLWVVHSIIVSVPFELVRWWNVIPLSTRHHRWGIRKWISKPIIRWNGIKCVNFTIVKFSNPTLPGSKSV